MRSTAPLLAVLAIVTLVGCAGDEEEATRPLPLAQRFLTSEEAPGSRPDPEETRQTTEEFDEFIATLGERAVDPDTEEMTEVFEEAGFESVGVDTRFYGETHAPGKSTHVVSSFIELDSDDGAMSALDWLETDVKKPCPMSCAVDRSSFDVDGISGARGVHLIATAEDIKKVGTPDQQPFEGYWIGFTDGAFVYTVDLFGRPGSVSEDQALEIASAYHDRLVAG